jgi:hypothetical protein
MSEPAANPFEVLRLGPDAPDDEVVRQAGRLRQRAADEAEVAALRRAVQALTGRPDERRVHQLLTHPHPCYHWPALDRFVAAFRRAPAADPTPHPPNLAELAVLLGPGADERRVIEALWRILLADPQAGKMADLLNPPS